MQRSAVALDRRLHLYAFPVREYRYSVVAHCARYDNNVAGADVRRRKLLVDVKNAYAGRVDEYLVALAALHYLGISCHYAYASLFGGLGHGKDYAKKLLHAEPFFDDKRRAKIDRLGPAPGQGGFGGADRGPSLGGAG